MDECKLVRVVEEALAGGCGLQPGQTLVLGVSGGTDSTCLLHILAQLGWPVIAATFDHQLRPESRAEGDAVAELAGSLGAAFTRGSGDVRAFARAERLPIEEAARILRYRFLFETARVGKAQAVAVAHNADDQAETVLMHLLRGAGLSGLKGMQARSFQEGWDAQIPLVRPLLMAPRSEISGYCRAAGLHPLEDASNADTAFFRNRLRHELLPTLETYNPRIREVLARTAAVLGAEYGVVEEALGAAWEQYLAREGAGYLAFRRGDMARLAPGLLFGLLRKAVARLRPGLRDISYEDIERAARFVMAPPRSGGIDLADGLRLFIENEWVYVEEAGRAGLPAEWPQMPSGHSLELLPGQSVELANGWRMSAERLMAHEARLDCGADEAWLDAQALILPLHVRAGRPGERFQPFGMGGCSQKLSDFWINQRVPRRARARWPLAVSGDEVVWVAGMRIGQAWAVKDTSSEVIHLRIRRQPD